MIFYIREWPTFKLCKIYLTIRQRAYNLRGYYQRIVTPAIANENRGFAIANCKFILNVAGVKPTNHSKYLAKETVAVSLATSFVAFCIISIRQKNPSNCLGHTWFLSTLKSFLNK